MSPENSFVILSIIGPHAIEGQSTIVDRKLKDIASCGYTLWFFKSTMHCNLIRAKECGVSIVRFLAPKSVNGAKDTKNAEKAKEYSYDGSQWIALDSRLSPVTGKIQRGSTCFNLKKLIPEDEGSAQHDLNQYKNLNGDVVKFDITKSTQIVSINTPGTTNSESKPRRLVLTGILDEEHPLVYVR
jgi:hypothetical protein